MVVAVVLVLCSLFLISCRSDKYSREDQARAFEEWHERVKNSVRIESNLMDIMADMAVLWAQGAFSRSEVSSETSNVIDKIGLNWDAAEDIIPLELTSQHKEDCRSAISLLKKAGEARVASLNALLSYYEDSSSSKLDTFTEKAIEAIDHVEESMDILERISEELSG